MRDTGIVRRIDELGRVVIPKEIRKTLRIKEGDPLEIYTDKDELLFRKYSPILSVGSFAESVAESLSEITENECIITDTDTVVYISGNRNKECLNKPVTEDMERIFKERKSVVLSKSDGSEIYQVCKDEQVKAENRIIVPIITNGDCYGSVILSSNDRENRFISSDVKLVQLCAMVLSKQFE